MYARKELDAVRSPGDGGGCSPRDWSPGKAGSSPYTHLLLKCSVVILCIFALSKACTIMTRATQVEIEISTAIVSVHRSTFHAQFWYAMCRHGFNSIQALIEYTINEEDGLSCDSDRVA